LSNFGHEEKKPKWDGRKGQWKEQALEIASATEM